MLLLIVLYVLDGLSGEMIFEGNTNDKEILLFSSSIVGTVSTNVVLVGAVLVFCAVFLTMLYFLAQELSKEEHDDYEVLQVISYYELNHYKPGLTTDLADSFLESRTLFLKKSHTDRADRKFQ